LVILILQQHIIPLNKPIWEIGGNDIVENCLCLSAENKDRDDPSFESAMKLLVRICKTAGNRSMTKKQRKRRRKNVLYKLWKRISGYGKRMSLLRHGEDGYSEFGK
jgi:hypothetical protein